MPPRRGAARQPTQHQNDEGAGPSNRMTFPEYVTFTLIQSMMVEGSMPEDDFKAVVRRLTQRNDDSAFIPVLQKIQGDMGYLELTLERIRFPVTKDRPVWYVCLVNKEVDESAKSLGSKYTPDQVQFFRAVLDALCGAPRPEGQVLGELNSMQLINAEITQNTAGATQSQSQAAGAGGTQAAGAKRKKLGYDEKERLIKSFARDTWLHQVREGYYSLGPRSLCELKDSVLNSVPEDVAADLQAYM